jgi:hypothetical protein
LPAVEGGTLVDGVVPKEPPLGANAANLSYAATVVVVGRQAPPFVGHDCTPLLHEFVSPGKTETEPVTQVGLAVMLQVQPQVAGSPAGSTSRSAGAV